MSKHCTSLTAQVSFAERVIVFIHELYFKVIPSHRQHAAISDIIRRFRLQVDARFEALDRLGVKEHEYQREVGGVAFDEVFDLCQMTRDACSNMNFAKYADEYLTPKRFSLLLYSMDESKLAELNNILHNAQMQMDLGELMMRVADIIDGTPNRYDAFNDFAKRKATRDVERIAATVETIAGGMDSIHRRIDESKAEIIERVNGVGTEVESMREEVRETKDAMLARVDELIAKMSRTRFDSKRNGKHTPRQKAVCQACWEIAQRDLKDATKGKVTREMAFAHCASVLEDCGVKTFKKFKAVLLTIQSTNSANSIKELEAKQEAARKAAKKSGVQASKKFGIMRAVKKTSRCAFAIAAATIGVLASPLRSDAVPMPLGGGGLPSRATRRSTPSRASWRILRMAA